MAKSVKTISLFLITFLIFSTTTNAQLSKYSYKVGLQASYVDVANEFESDGLSMLFRPFARFELSDYFDLGAGIGYGWMNMKDYGGNPVENTFIPIDVRLLFSPIESKVWNPYIYAGAGAVSWSVGTKSITPPSNTDDSGFNFFVPAGIGIEFALSDNLLLDITAGGNIAFTDAMNGYETPNAPSDAYSNDRWWNYGIGLAYSGGGCEVDPDNDGLTTCEEEELGTNPNKADTDGDGLNDGEEMMKYNTDPLKSDSDKDQLSDGSEVKTHLTNPNKADTDGDTLTDGEEVNTYMTDPTKVDTDGDTLSDGNEVNTHKTDPTKADTDGDKLSDGDEINTHKTDPLKSDTDGDKLSDGDEVLVHKTNPLITDTDKGSVDDGTEVLVNSTNPLDASDDIIVEVDLEVYFNLNKSNLLSEAISTLKNELGNIQKATEAGKTIMISGHCDASGPEAFNDKLSVDRANAIAKWLVENGIDESKLDKKGFGKTDPKYNGDKDRRVKLNIK